MADINSRNTNLLIMNKRLIVFCISIEKMEKKSHPNST